MHPTFFNLDALEGGVERQLSDGMKTTVFVGENVMISIVEAAPGAAGKIHAHPEEQWGFLIEGSGTRIQNGERIAVSKGAFWQTPGNVEHGFEAGPDGAKVIDVFSPPRDAYRKAGAGFGS
ncbi:MAG: cupin domain-containing protein [Pseudomonadota bacterium]